jgi:hypothetical protein
VISHFIQGIERNCTFFNLSGNRELEDETPLHLFFQCLPVENLITDFFSDILGTTVSRQEYFGFPTRQNNHSNIILYYVSLLIKKYIWDCKQRQVLPSSDWLNEYFFSEFKTMTSISINLRNSVDLCGFSLLFRTGCVKETIC